MFFVWYKRTKLECDLYIKDETCIQKVRKLNKNKMEIMNNPNVDIKKKEMIKEDIC